MKRVRTGKKEAEELTNTVDGVTGSDNVANKFKEVFEALFNSVEDKPDLEEVEVRIRLLLQKEDTRNEVNKMTAEVVKQATLSMKGHKIDVSQGFSSDAFLKAPDELFNCIPGLDESWNSDKICSCMRSDPAIKRQQKPGQHRQLQSHCQLLPGPENI